MSGQGGGVTRLSLGIMKDWITCYQKPNRLLIITPCHNKWARGQDANFRMTATAEHGWGLGRGVRISPPPILVEREKYFPQVLRKFEPRVGDTLTRAWYIRSGPEYSAFSGSRGRAFFLRLSLGIIGDRLTFYQYSSSSTDQSLKITRS